MDGSTPKLFSNSVKAQPLNWSKNIIETNKLLIIKAEKTDLLLIYPERRAILAIKPRAKKHTTVTNPKFLLSIPNNLSVKEYWFAKRTIDEIIRPTAKKTPNLDLLNESSTKDWYLKSK